jgi:hypothetical protein
MGHSVSGGVRQNQMGDCALEASSLLRKDRTMEKVLPIVYHEDLFSVNLVSWMFRGFFVVVSRASRLRVQKIHAPLRCLLQMQMSMFSSLSDQHLHHRRDAPKQ